MLNEQIHHIGNALDVIAAQETQTKVTVFCGIDIVPRVEPDPTWPVCSICVLRAHGNVYKVSDIQTWAYSKPPATLDPLHPPIRKYRKKNYYA